MSLANIGLGIFVLIVGLDATGLLIDLCRWLMGLPTITMGLLDCPVLGFLVAAAQLLVPVGFFLHLYAREVT